MRRLLALRPGQSLAYIVGTATVGMFTAFGMFVVVWCPPLLVVVGLWIGRFERRRVLALTSDTSVEPHAEARSGWLGWVWLRLREAVTWREVAYTLCLVAVLFPIDAVIMSAFIVCGVLVLAPLLFFTMPDGEFSMHLGAWTADTAWESFVVALAAILVIVAGGHGLRFVAAGQAAFARWLLLPTSRESRRLLAHRALDGVRDLAAACKVPVEVELTLPGRPSWEVESVVQGVVSEALTNVVRHAAATRVQITGGIDGDLLWLTITDDGRGGADPAAGTRLRALADRLAGLDGTLEVSSPPGGPTVVRVGVPAHAERR
ncbi:sensor histidine kinase [Dactylosporangium siamense]|uniref:histidine kinase n=1 Tax=Dactylosporangium siamense TaxID=685454 RepID=A0A919PUP4_9ACTN|nr:sensor domain-containing protein [Dactylosporangium siamense]GIG50851.1 hypothetical protein Dsi01nite_088920 [Dactylosporangium siamense]